MAVAQKIAGVLGETTAETKISLTALINVIGEEMPSRTRLRAEVAVAQLNKHGEGLRRFRRRLFTTRRQWWLCRTARERRKAHILASLTCKMASTMLKGGLELSDDRVDVEDAAGLRSPPFGVQHLFHTPDHARQHRLSGRV